MSANSLESAIVSIFNAIIRGQLYLRFRDNHAWISHRSEVTEIQNEQDEIGREKSAKAD